jgi:hypothetical protein
MNKGKSAAVYLIVALVVASVAYAQAVHRSLTLDVNAARNKVLSGDPILIKVELKNTSGHAIPSTEMPGGDVHGELIGFRAVVRDAQGKEPSLTKWGRLVYGRQTPEDAASLQLDAVRKGRLDPGGVQKTEIHVSDIYDLTAPGKYTIQVGHYDDDIKEEILSTAITVAVTK